MPQWGRYRLCRPLTWETRWSRTRVVIARRICWYVSVVVAHLSISLGPASRRVVSLKGSTTETDDCFQYWTLDRITVQVDDWWQTSETTASFPATSISHRRSPKPLGLHGRVVLAVRQLWGVSDLTVWLFCCLTPHIHFSSCLQWPLTCRP